MKETRRQHYIQKRLLKNFSKDNQLWVFDKKELKSFSASISDVGLEKDFLQLNADKIVRKIENECYHILERIREKECVLCRHFNDIEAEENYFRLYRYIGCQLARTPRWRVYLENLRAIFVNITDLKETQSKFFTETKYLSFLNFNRDKENNRGKNIGFIANLYNNWTKTHSKITQTKFDEISACLIDITMPFILINRSPTPFMINDLGANWHYGLDGVSYDFSMDGKFFHSWLSFPISPRICILLCTLNSTYDWAKSLPKNSDRGLLIQTNNKKQIDIINKLNFNSAIRFVYFSSQTLCKQASKIYQ